MLLLLLACASDPHPLDLDAVLAGVCDRPDLTVPEADHLVVFEGPAPELAVHVVLNGGLVVDGAPTDPTELAGRLAEKAAVARELGEVRPGSAELLLEIAADTPAPDVVHTLQAAEAQGYDRIQFLGRSREARPPVSYADPAFGARLDAAERLPPEHSATAYNDATDGVLEACPPLLAALSAQKTAPNRCEALPETLRTAFVACPDADHRKIVTVFQHDPFSGPAVLTAHRTELAPEGSVVEVAPTDTWADVAPRLQAAGPTTRWVVVDQQRARRR